MTISQLADYKKKLISTQSMQYYHKKYRLAYTLKKRVRRYYYFLYFFDQLFKLYQYFQKPLGNNIMNVDEKVRVFNGHKILICNALLDTGNAGYTIISMEMVKKLGYKDTDTSNVVANASGFGGGGERMKTIYLEYKICDFQHRGLVAISNTWGKNTSTYGMIISRSDISKMYHSGYYLHV